MSILDVLVNVCAIIIGGWVLYLILRKNAKDPTSSIAANLAEKFGTHRDRNYRAPASVDDFRQQYQGVVDFLGMVPGGGADYLMSIAQEALKTGVLPRTLRSDDPESGKITAAIGDVCQRFAAKKQAVTA